MLNIEWKPIKDYEDLYIVSNTGLVKRIKFINGKHNFGQERLLKPILNKDGYMFVRLCKDGKTKNKRIHKLVANAFLGESDLQVDHIDGNKQNNRLDNLEYITQKENVQDAYNNGLCENSRKQAKKNILKASEQEKVKINQYDLKGNFIKQWSYIRQVQKELGISNSNIVACCKGKRKSAGGYIWKYN